MQNDKTRKAYAKVGTDLVLFCLGVITGKIIEFKTSFNEEIAEAGTAFLVALQKTSTSDQDETLQTFLFSLFSQKRCGEADKYTYLTFAFLVPYSYSDSGTLRPCSVFSQFFSQTIFFGRAAIFNCITYDAKHEKKGFFE